MVRRRVSWADLGTRIRRRLRGGVLALVAIGGLIGLSRQLKVPTQPPTVLQIAPEGDVAEASRLQEIVRDATLELPRRVLWTLSALATVDLEPVSAAPLPPEVPAQTKPPAVAAKAIGPAPSKSTPKVAPAVAAVAEVELFPTPKFLAPAVEFWERVYSQYGSDHYLLHDRETLIVFAILDLSSVPEQPRQRQRLLESELAQYRRRLRRLGEKLADGTPVEKLPPEEQRWVSALMKLEERDPFTAASERLRVQKGQRDQFEVGLRRAGRYLDDMEAIFRREGLPAALCLLPHVESSFNDRAISKAGASGIWQFMPETGKMYLRIGQEVDERNDPILATEAAARLLDKNFRHLGSWPLALTAYNHGLSGMLRAVRETGETDLGEIVQRYSSPTFGFASKNFYCEFLAARRVATNQPEHFPELRPDPPLRFAELALPRALQLQAIAKSLKVGTEELHALNPALQKPVLKGSRAVPRGYRLRLPARKGIDWHAAVQAVEPPIERVSAAGTRAAGTHTVQPGDTLGALARRYRTSVRSIIASNRLRSANHLKVGQKLRLPAPS